MRIVTKSVKFILLESSDITNNLWRNNTSTATVWCIGLASDMKYVHNELIYMCTTHEHINREVMAQNIQVKPYSFSQVWYIIINYYNFESSSYNSSSWIEEDFCKP